MQEEERGGCRRNMRPRGTWTVRELKPNKKWQGAPFFILFFIFWAAGNLDGKKNEAKQKIARGARFFLFLGRF